jgi:hypothetical protein
VLVDAPDPDIGIIVLAQLIAPFLLKRTITGLVPDVTIPVSELYPPAATFPVPRSMAKVLNTVSPFDPPYTNGN